MEDRAVRILDERRVMAVSTLRPDGWPQTTMVGYANDGLLIYFLVFRNSQKFANIQSDPRISIAVGEEPDDLTGSAPCSARPTPPKSSTPTSASRPGSCSSSAIPTCPAASFPTGRRRR